MIDLKEYQRAAVNQLKKRVIKQLNRSQDRQKIVLQAPTGAGKTVMASAMLDELKAEVEQSGECRYDRVAFIWIAPNKLHIQSYKSLKNYFSETHNLRTLMFDEVDVSGGYLESGDILFLNWESVNKENAILRRDNEMNHNLSTLVRRTKEQDIPIIVIIDEEHYYTGANAKKSEEILKLINPKIELRISATPITTNADIVQIPREDVIEEEMIKRSILLNPAVSSSEKFKDDLTVNQQLLEKALRKRNELAKAYQAMGVNINPLLLIQLPNDNKEALSTEDQTIRDEVTSYLDNLKNISVNNGKLAVWLSDNKDKVNLDEITKMDSLVDVLLFKQAISKGWDCPRAAVLLIYRELSDVRFTIQTVGRILRMPEQRYYTDDRLNVGYVYTNLSEDAINIANDEMNYMTKANAFLREGVENISLGSAYVKAPKKVHNRLGYDFRKHLMSVFAHEFHINELQGQIDFDENDDDYLIKMLLNQENQDTTQQQDVYTANRMKVGAAHIQIDVTKLYVVVPRDLQLADPDHQSRVEVVEKARLTRNAAETSRLFTLFCRAHVGKFSKFDSTPVLRGALIAFADEYLGMTEAEAMRMYLAKVNVAKWEDLIKKTLAGYELKLQARQGKQTEGAMITHNFWSLPDSRSYNPDFYQNKDKTIHKHALRPFYEQIEASNPEKNFAEWIDKKDNVAWWYKNGDNGAEHFAVAYKDTGGRDSLFYVDFIIYMKDGSIYLLDTKTRGSDPEAPSKHNALRRFMEEQNKNGTKLKGGVLIQDGLTWKYPELDITDTDDITGWTTLTL